MTPAPAWRTQWTQMRSIRKNRVIKCPHHPRNSAGAIIAAAAATEPERSHLSLAQLVADI